MPTFHELTFRRGALTSARFAPDPRSAIYSASWDGNPQAVLLVYGHRPTQSVANFIQQSNAVIAHDAQAQLGRIKAPTLITFGRHDMATSTRCADPMTVRIRNSELLIFEGCAHAPIYESVAEFNDKTLQFLKRHAGSAIAAAS